MERLSCEIEQLGKLRWRATVSYKNEIHEAEGMTPARALMMLGMSMPDQIPDEVSR
jgi:hypothetical protein